MLECNHVRVTSENFIAFRESSKQSFISSYIGTTHGVWQGRGSGTKAMPTLIGAATEMVHQHDSLLTWL